MADGEAPPVQGGFCEGPEKCSPYSGENQKDRGTDVLGKCLEEKHRGGRSPSIKRKLRMDYGVLVADKL